MPGIYQNLDFKTRDSLSVFGNIIRANILGMWEEERGFTHYA